MDQSAPTRHIPTDDQRVRLISREIADEQIIQHLHLCPFAADSVGPRLRAVEISMGRLIGFLLGSGALGGASGAIVAKLIGH